MKPTYTLAPTRVPHSATSDKPYKETATRSLVPHTAIDLRLLKSGTGWTLKALQP